MEATKVIVKGYVKSSGLYFYELDEKGQEYIKSNYDFLSLDELETTLFFPSPIHKDEYLFLGDFLRNEGYLPKFIHGFLFLNYGAFYGVTFSRDGETALISYAVC